MIFRLSQGGICLSILIPWRAITFCLGNCTSWDSPAAMSPFKSGLLLSKWILKSRTNKLYTIDRGYLSLAPPQPSTQKKIRKNKHHPFSLVRWNWTLLNGHVLSKHPEVTCEVNVHRWMCPCRSWTAYHLGENDQSKNKTYKLWPAYGHFFSGIHWPNRNISPTLQVAILPFEEGDVAMPHVTTAVGFSYIILFPPKSQYQRPASICGGQTGWSWGSWYWAVSTSQGCQYTKGSPSAFAPPPQPVTQN